MLIDWFTVSAQIVNFLILIWLLKQFLYKPILRAMEAREQKIVSQLQNAEATKAEAEAAREQLRIARTEFETQKEALLRQARDDAETTRKRLGEQVRREIETLRSKWLETLRQEQDTLRGQLESRVQQEIFAIAEQALRDLAGEQLEQQILLVFLRQLKALDGNEKETFSGILKISRDPVVIRSAFALDGPERAEIENTIKETLVPNARVRFETASELIGGIEMIASGHKLSWSIGEYLSTLEEKVREVLEHNMSSDEESK